MGEARRSELLYQGQIDAAGSVVNAELRSNGRVYAIMDRGVVLAHFLEPEVTFADGFMVIVGHPPGEVDGVTATWRIPKPEIFSLRLNEMTVKAGDRPDLKGATVSQSQYRVRIEGPAGSGVDLSLPGAQLGTINGKRSITSVDGDVFMLEEKDCGCGTKR